MASETATRLLDTAQGLIRSRGYNAFSYKDLAETVGIRTASIHYHFPAKADLVGALMERYAADLEAALTRIDSRRKGAESRLRAFFDLYRTTENDGAICVCGSLASDWETLPPPVRDAVDGYLRRSEAWVADVIRTGVKDGEFDPCGTAVDLAMTCVAGLQGGLIVGRARTGRSAVGRIQKTLLAALGVG